MEKTFAIKVKEELSRHVNINEKIDLSRVTFDKVVVKKDLRVKFIKHGNIYDPKNGHHFEYNFNNPNDANITLMELELYNVTAKLSANNNNRYMVYIVDKGTIMDVLRLLGATKTLKEYNDIVTYKDVAKKVNRENNCDVANIKKAANAALKQVADIKKLFKQIKKNKLQDKLREAAEMRLKYPSLSIKELAEKLKISKSALNHRFIKLRSMIE